MLTYILKVKNRNTRKRCEISSKLTHKEPEDVNNVRTTSKGSETDMFRVHNEDTRTTSHLNIFHTFF